MVDTIVVGVDSHKDTLVGCAVDSVGRPRSSDSFANTPVGHNQALSWVRTLEAQRVAIEGSGGFGRPLALLLGSAGVQVVDVPPQMTARARKTLRNRDKCDLSDACVDSQSSNARRRFG